jgi:hypothetical protein
MYQKYWMHFLVFLIQCYINRIVVVVSLSKLRYERYCFLYNMKCLGCMCLNSSVPVLLSHRIVAVTVSPLTAMFSLQTFAIPGSISLSILSGFLFPFPQALLLVCFCSATGASLCYMLSYFLGRHLVYRYFPEKATQWALTVSKLTNMFDLRFSQWWLWRVLPSGL